MGFILPFRSDLIKFKNQTVFHRINESLLMMWDSHVRK